MESTTSELLSSGGTATTYHASRAGYLPVPLAHVPPKALGGINVFVRAGAGEQTDGERGVYLPYRGESPNFSGTDRQALLEGGVELVYIKIEDHDRFRSQAEAQVAEIAADPNVATSAKASLVYETGVELINDILGDPDVGRFSGQLRTLAKSTATIVLKNEDAFSHLFSASHHDFYTATHMVNVATYIVPLAHKMGYRDPDELTLICEAALLHDIGKNFVPSEILNCKEKLSDEQWTVLRDHARIGAEHLAKFDVDELLVRVAGEHHERLDGGGYPFGKSADEIHPISKLCAVVDSFDAMTALRPFKKRTLTPLEALKILREEAPHKLWHDAVEAWAELLSTVDTTSVPLEMPALDAAADDERRAHKRYKLNCPARVALLDAAGTVTGEQLDVRTHSISATGVGVLAQAPIEVGSPVRAYLESSTWAHEYLTGVVVRCRGYQDGWYDVGVRLTGRGARGEEDGSVAAAITKLST